MRLARSIWLRRAAWGVLIAAGLGLRLAGQAAPPAAGSTSAPTSGATGAPSGWQFSGQVMQGIDSNVFYSLQQPVADTTTQVQLTLGGHWAGPQWSFTGSYMPLGTNYARHTNLDYFSQTYQQGLTYSPSQHTQWTWSLSAQRFPERGNPAFAGGGLLETSTASEALALGTVMSGTSSSLGLTHATSPHSSWSASVSGGAMWYGTDTSLVAGGGTGVAGTVQSDERTYNAGANLGWTHQVSPATSVVLGASGSQIWFFAPDQRIRYANLQASIQHRLGQVFSVQAGAGPAWSSVVAGPATTLASQNALPTLGYAANAGITAEEGHSHYGLTWQHADQAGYVPGGIITDMLAFQYGVQWGRSWSSSISVGRSSTQELAGSGTAGFDSAFGSGQISYHFATSWSLLANASYFTQTEPIIGGTGRFRHALGSIGISYTSGGAR